MERNINQREEAAAVLIQMWFRKKWWWGVKRKRLRRGFKSMSKAIAKYARWWAVERMKRGSALVLKFLDDCSKSNKVQNAIRSFFYNIGQIQAAWRRYLAWRGVVREGRVELWDRIEEENLENWTKAKVRLQAMYRDSNKSREEILRETGGFDMYTPPQAVPDQLRDEMIHGDLKSSQREYIAVNQRYMAELTEYLRERRKNMMIDQALK